MSATITSAAAGATTTTTTDQRDRSTSRRPSLCRAGITAGLVAAAATSAIATGAHAAGVSLETAPGEQIPALGFGQLTLFFTAIGVALAAVLRRKARCPQATFVKVTLALTALSVVPDLVLSTDVATKLTLVLTHLVAAAIVIPIVASRLPERR
jgi:hypothetical protein